MAVAVGEGEVGRDVDPLELSAGAVGDGVEEVQQTVAPVVGGARADLEAGEVHHGFEGADRAHAGQGAAWR